MASPAARNVRKRMAALVLAAASACTASSPEVVATTGPPAPSSIVADLGGGPPPRTTSPPVPSAREAGQLPACPPGGLVGYPEPQPIAGTPAGPLEIVGQWGGATRAVAVVGSRVYTGVGSTLVTVDAVDPADPREVGVSSALGGAVEDVTLADGRAFVAAGAAGLYVLDPASADLKVVAHVPLPGYSTSVAVSGRHAFVAAGTRGLRIVALDGAAREVAAIDDGTFASAVAVEGATAFLAAGLGGLVVIDVGEPEHPRLLAAVPSAGFAYGVAVRDRTVYIADAWEGIAVVDVGERDAPRLVDQVDLPGWAFDVTTSGKELVVAAGLGGVRLFDLTDAHRPSATQAISFAASHIASTALADGLILAADLRHGLHVIERSPALGSVGLFAPLGFADGIAVAGDRAYVAAGDTGLRILDIADRAAPRELAAFDAPGFTQTVSVADGHAMVTSFTRELFVIDARDPLQLTGAKYDFELGTTRNTIVHGTTLLMANEWGLRMFDVSDPGRICELSFMNIQDAGGAGGSLETFSSTGVAAIGSMAYLVGGGSGGIRAIDISDPRRPTQMGEHPGQFEDVVALDGATVAVIGGSPDDGRVWLRTFDVTDPRRMREIGAFELPALSAGWGPFLARSGRALFVSAGRTLIVFDLVEGAPPRHAASVPMPSGVSALAADESHVYAATEAAGVTILRFGPAARSSGGAQPAQRARYRTPPLEGELESAVADGPPSPTEGPPGQTYVVTSTADGGPGSLRDRLGNATAGDVIRFDPTVFRPSQPATIAVQTALPDLSAGRVTIDASDAGVILEGEATPPGTDGLLLRSDGNVVKGLQILGFPSSGIRIVDGHGNTIGGDRSRGRGPSGEGNVISGNGASGITTDESHQRAYRPHVPGNVIVGNYIGFDAGGIRVIGNGGDGVQLTGANDRLGGPEPWERNVIVGSALSEVASDAAFSRVVGNYIGTDPAGRRSVSTTGHWAVQMGAGYARVEGNVIAGSRAGIWMEGPQSGREIVGNIIGFDATGTVEIAQGGIAFVEGYSRIGGVTPEDRNLIAGYVLSGGAQSRDVFILGNWLGVNAGGRRNAEGRGEVEVVGARHIVAANTVVGRGIRLSGGSSDNLVVANNVAADPTGRIALEGDGIRVTASDRNAVQLNVIGSREGVIVEGGSADNTIRDNVILR